MHHTASPRPTSSQCSAWTRVAKMDPCVCATSFRTPPTPLVATTNARSREPLSCEGTSVGTSFELRFAPSSKRYASVLKPIRSIVCPSERSATTRTASVEDTMRSSCDDVVVGAHGTTTAPTFHAPSTASSHSTVVPAITMTRSPAPTRRSRIACRPDGGALGDLEEGAMLDDPVRPEVRQRATLGVAGERLDHVAGEVEAVGNLPAAVDMRLAQGELQRRAGQLVSAPTASADTKTFHGLTIIDPKRRLLNPNPVIVAEAALRATRDRARARRAGPTRDARAAGIPLPPRARRSACGPADAC